MRPSSGRSKPAIIRNVVVLPQPDAPSREKNSPLAMSRSIPATAVTSSKRWPPPPRRTAPPAGASSSCPDRPFIPSACHRGRQAAQVRDEPIYVGVRVLHRHEPLLDFAPWGQE